MAVGDLMSLQIHQLTDNRLTECAISFQAITDDVLWRENVVDEWIENLSTLWFSMLSDQVALDNITAVDVWPGTAVDFVWDPDDPIEGQVAEKSLPAHTALLVGWRTAIKGRSGRGRVYIPGIPHTAIADDQRCRFEWFDWIESIGGDHFAQWGPGGASDQAQLVVISRQVDNVVRPNPIGIPVTDIHVEPFWVSQRRRVTRYVSP